MTRTFRLYLVRHGWTAWHTERRVAGWSDIPLNERGVAEAQAVGNWLADRLSSTAPRIVSSPVTRARQTAETIAQRLPSVPTVVLDERLADTHVGHWEGRLVDDIQRDDPTWPRFFDGPATFKFPGGEALQDVQQRAVAVVADLATEGAKEPVILVAHADPLRCIIAHYLNMDLNHVYRMRLDCGSVSRLSLPLENPDRPGNWPRLDFLNLTEHLTSAAKGTRS